MRECVVVSEEMLALVDGAATDGIPMPADPVALCLRLTAEPAIAFAADPDAPGDIVLLVARSACSRIFARDVDDGHYHLPQELRQIALAIRNCALDGAARTTYRLGKAIELLCESFRLLDDGALVPVHGQGVVSIADARRLAAARQLIDERWHEKLTIDGIARACGLNRVKLTRGFREMFNSSVASAIAERRLDAAQLALRTTDKPISLIGYDSGYLNNASFARAFARRFGTSPSDYRASGCAA